MNSRFQTLHAWLQWQETLHPQAIDLGLERAAAVFRRMRCDRPAPLVITVSGTNGKGSCIALLEQIILQAGYKTGAYTSPHLLNYNERIRINGEPVTDDELIAAFSAVDAARESESLTYFEFGTLAALQVFAWHKPDVALLEVGMGGRLDATNIIDADAALIASIGLDHQQWLGGSREEIAREKAGILRPGQAAICGDPDPPPNLHSIAAALPLELKYLNRDFGYRLGDKYWDWYGADTEYLGLPLPRMRGEAQLRNAASVLMLLQQVQAKLPISRPAIERGLQTTVLPGRQQFIRQQPQVLLDVAHNAEAITELMIFLRDNPAPRLHMVFAMLKDKPVTAIVRELQPYVDKWYLAAAITERALPVAELAAIVESAAGVCRCYESIAAAFTAAMLAAQADERIVVTGSFWTVSEVLACYDSVTFR